MTVLRGGVLILVWVLCAAAAPWAGLPVRAGPPASVDAVAARLAPLTTDGEADGRGERLDDEVSACGAVLDSGDPDGGSPMPQPSVPAYEGRVLVPFLESPVSVHVWLVPQAEAGRRVALARKKARECVTRGRSLDGAGGRGRSDVSADSGRREGWSVSRSTEVGRSGTDTDPDLLLKSFIRQRVVASRGALLAELNWQIRGTEGMPGMPWWRARGEEAVAAILAAIGGDPAGRGPSGGAQDAPTARLAAALPDRTAYGLGVTTGDDGPMMCGERPLVELTRLEEPAARTRARRRSAGPVSVTETVSIYTRESAAIAALAKDLDARRSAIRPGGDPLTCANHTENGSGSVIEADDPRPEEQTSYVVEALARDGWTGHLDAVAARLRDLPEHPSARDSVARAHLMARRGTTVVELTWESPAGRDLQGTLVRGRAALLRTLGAL